METQKDKKMKITFDTQNENELQEVVTLLENMGMSKAGRLEEVIPPREIASANVEEPKKENPAPSIPKEEKAPEEPKKTPKKSTKSSITLADLKESAKNAVARTSREDVKGAIGEFAPKLAEVVEADFGKLYKKLQELGA